MKWILTREYYEDYQIEYQYDIEEDVLEVPKHKLKYFKSFIKKNNRILSRIGIPTIDIKKEENISKEFKVRNGGAGIGAVEIQVPTVRIEFTYPTNMQPDNDWILVAVVDHDQRLLKHIKQDIRVPSELVNLDKSHCDRCKKTLRRHKTLIIYNKNTGEYLRAGGSCIKFYLGVNYDRFLNVLNKMEGLSNPEWIDGTDYEKPDYINHWDYFTYDKESVVRVTLNWLEDNDYVSRKYSTDTNPATSSEIYDIFFNAFYRNYWYSNYGSRYNDDQIDMGEAQHEADIAKYEKYNKPHKDEKELYDFIRSLSPEESSYNMNIVKMFQSDEKITGAQFGLLVSIVPYFQKSVGKQKERAKINNEHVGTIGEKYPFERVKVLNTYWQDGDFGSYTKYIMEDSEGHRLVKNGTINKRYAIEGLERDEVVKGTILQFNGEVRYHGEYKGIKNTTIGRISKYTGK